MTIERLSYQVEFDTVQEPTADEERIMFAGVVVRKSDSFPNEYSTAETLINALTPYQQADQTGSWETEKAIIVHALTWNTGISKIETSPYQCPHSQLVITSWIRLDNRESLAKMLDIEGLDCHTDPMLVIEAYRKWGKQCANRLEGDFSFIIYDPQRHECFAARDSIGVKPFFYYLDEKVFIFSSTAAIFPKMKLFDLRPNKEWMVRFLAGISASFTATGFEQVLKLPPAHTLQISENFQEEVEEYFVFQDDAPLAFERNSQWVSEYREKLDSAVINRVNSAYPISSESSGGLDSSTVTALAALHLPHNKSRFHVFGCAMYEQEPSYILETSLYHGISHNHIYTRFGLGDKLGADFEREMNVLGYPSEHGNATAHTPFYKLSQQFGIRTLLSGFGGDEVVTNPGDLLSFELIDAGRYDILHKEMPGSLPMRLARAIKKIHSAKKQGKPDKTSLEEAHRLRAKNLILSRDADQQYGVIKDLVEISRYDADYRRINAHILNNHCFKPFISTRTDNCTLMAASFGVDYRWPLLERSLMQQYLNTPSIEKYCPKYDRYLHRRAVDGVVPVSIVWKQSKSMGEISAQYQPDYEEPWSVRRSVGSNSSALHKKLTPLVDQEKHLEQIQVLRLAPPDKRFDARIFMFKRNSQAIQQLNKWLNYYF